MTPITPITATARVFIAAFYLSLNTFYSPGEPIARRDSFVSGARNAPRVNGQVKRYKCYPRDIFKYQRFAKLGIAIGGRPNAVARRRLFFYDPSGVLREIGDQRTDVAIGASVFHNRMLQHITPFAKVNAKPCREHPG